MNRIRYFFWIKKIIRSNHFDGIGIRCTTIDNRRLKPITLVDQVENRIHEYIRINNLKKNDAIPNEKDLATSLSVSRSIVREALSRLKMLGIVESRTRRGIILKEPPIINSFNKVVNPKLMGDDSLYDLSRL